MERREGDRFPDSYFALHPPVNRRKIYSWPDYLTSRLVEQGSLQWVGTIFLWHNISLFREITRYPKPGAISSYLLNLILAGNCGNKFDLFVSGKQVEFFYLTIGRLSKRELRIKQLRRSWQENSHLIENPIFIRWRRTRKHLFLFHWILWSMWSSQLHKNVWGAQGLVASTRRLYMGGY